MTMARSFRLVLLLLVLIATVGLEAAGTATVTGAYPSGAGNIVRYTVAWTSDGSGNVNTNKFSITAGRLVAAKIVPGTAGAQPTNLYSVSLKDDDGVDVLNGAGANQSNATGTYIAFDPPLFFDSAEKLDLQISAAGASKSGTFYLWVQP